MDISTLLTPEEAYALRASLLYTNSISFILGTICVIIHIMFKKKLLFSLSFFFCLQITLSHLVFLLGPMVDYAPLQESGILCNLQGAGLQFTNIAGACWFLCIAIHMYLIVFKDYTPAQLEKYFVIPSHIFSWGLPLLSTVVVLCYPGMTYKIMWCWVPQIDSGVWEWVFFYGPILVFLTVVAIIWILSTISVCKRDPKRKTRTYLTQTLVGVFLIFTSYIIQVSHRIYNVFYPNGFLFQEFHVIANGLLGTLAFLVFGITYRNVLLCKDKFSVRQREDYDTIVNT
eukprot:TRINITY_DN10432_c0_g1_i1.p1 TRINITY_DN10432_c0_g1~~TRINITY_DN10432_c0_g1_i1.p1  ORF type:complete len:286 (+),score=18.94 TRINITY_DN10432_c0_g1_i1:89-946(+)